MTARDEFQAGVREVRVLLNTIALTAPGESEESVTARSNAVRRASVVLLVAHFESYLKSLAMEFIDHLGSGAVEVRRMPPALRELHTLRVVSDIQRSASAAEREAHFKKLDRVAVLWKDDAKPSKGTLRPELLSREVTSAKADKVDRLFHLMGYRDEVCAGDIDVDLDDSGISTLNIRRGLEDVVGCRDAVAHGDPTRQPTSQDVDRYIAFMQALAARFERRASHLREIVSSSP